jgi:sterol desaturase/sphingolipid hydroxylase (fatty acid hydroxylase superfamily)
MGNFFLVLSVTGILMLSAVCCMMLVRKKVSHAILEKNNDVAGFIYAVVGVIYAVLLAFVVIVVWELYREADTKVQEEVRFMSSLFRDARIFGEPHRSAIQDEIVNYTNIVINEEWPLMNKGKSSEKALDSLHRVFDLYTKIQPRNDYEKIWYQETIQKLNNFSDARNQRILAGKAAVPGFMWIVLIVGGIITVGFSFLFSTINTWAQMLMVGSLSGIITLVLLMIIAIDRPFQGIIAVQPEAFIEQLSHFKNYLKPQQ